MTINQERTGSTLAMKVTGRLDTTTAPQLSAALDESLGDAQALALDFADLEYISSAGLRVLLHAQKIMAARDGMVLRNINETVREVLEVTGFSDILTIE